MQDNKKSKIDKLLKDYIKDFNKKKKLPIVVKGSIPVVWFGDIDKYLASPKKILTVGLNPSEQEFMFKDDNGLKVALPESERRFEQINLWKGATKKNVEKLKNTLNNYFKQNPYRWFNKYNKLIEVFDCSYGGKYGSLTNAAIHIDIYSAIATTPTWGKLDSSQQNLIKNTEFFNELLEELNPDLVLVSINKETFCKIFSGCNKIRVYEYPGNNRLEIFEHDGRIVINGTNMQGMPFGGIKEECVKEVFAKAKNLCFYKKCGYPQIECSVGFLIGAGVPVEDIFRECYFYSGGYCKENMDEEILRWEK